MKKKLTMLASMLIILTSCTENQRAKSFGGTMTVNLPPNSRLVNVTWKDTQCWYLTRPMTDDETPTSYTFTEKSDFGMIEGKIIFNETTK